MPASVELIRAHDMAIHREDRRLWKTIRDENHLAQRTDLNTIDIFEAYTDQLSIHAGKSGETANSRTVYDFVEFMPEHSGSGSFKFDRYVSYVGPNPKEGAEEIDRPLVGYEMKTLGAANLHGDVKYLARHLDNTHGSGSDTLTRTSSTSLGLKSVSQTKPCRSMNI
jgi:hypothetical protein